MTGTRAEYGLLRLLMEEIDQDPDLILQLIVTGMHLSPEFGLTYRHIEADGFKIDAKIEMLVSSDTSVGTTKSIALGMIGFADVLNRLSPDMIVLLGDRFELLAVAQAALVQKIPVAHIHGGELSEGAIDDAIRHSLSKMSHLHFVAAEPYRKRVIQLGEHPDRVFNVGTPGLERITKTTLLSQKELENRIGFKLGKINFLVTYHPVTLESQKNAAAIQGIFDALDHFPEANVIFTKANADEEGRLINTKIDDYVRHHPDRSISYTSLGDLNYLSMLQFVDAVMGNSSSGLIEVPYFGKPTINIGNRQKNRLRAQSVIDCSHEKDEILSALLKVLSSEFKSQIKNMTLLYRQDQTASKIKNIIKNTDVRNLLLKSFYDTSINIM